jgi:hypothetical protein
MPVSYFCQENVRNITWNCQVRRCYVCYYSARMRAEPTRPVRRMWALQRCWSVGGLASAASRSDSYPLGDGQEAKRAQLTVHLESIMMDFMPNYWASAARIAMAVLSQMPARKEMRPDESHCSDQRA